MLALRSSQGVLNSLKVYRLAGPISLLSTKSSAKQEQERFWAKNAKLNRPLSPHLSIYRLPLTANMSIGHRATGILMATTIYAFGITELLYGVNFDKIFQVLQDIVPPHYALVAKYLLAFPLCYHMLTGIRHLVWDAGFGFRLDQLVKSALIIIPSALILTAIVATI